ncbi:unnamed protein product [Cyprideis torosa]|uniref:Zinc/cadmium resistance protein n=1 Tax=Cyprideis torosa TaxID=163714 RepID=A0A7R8WC90_9CRUS|nr:unnamed protein product [Cyprideis torosa]CAG0888205.1 unnamed protein product [Cyprideis torosa]
MTNGARTLDNVANPLNGLVRVTSSPPQLAVETEGGRSRQRREETAAGKSEGNFRSSSSSDVSTSETEGSYDRNNMALLVAYIGVMKGGDPGALSHGQVKIGGDNGSQGKLTAVPSGECELENVRQRPTSPNGSPAKDDVEAAGSEGAGAGTKSGEGGTKVEVRQMNMRGIFLHVLADALGSVIVVISALVIWKTDWEYRFYLDPALSILMVLMILKSVWPLLVESAMVLLQTVPPHIRVEAIQNRIIQEVDGVLALHEFHVWQLTGDRIIASAHVRCKNLHDYKEISQKIKEIFHEEGIHSTTIQPEFAEEYLESIPGAVARGNAGNSCALDCPPNTNCAASTCCPPAKSPSPSQSSTPSLNALDTHNTHTVANDSIERTLSIPLLPCSPSLSYLRGGPSRRQRQRRRTLPRTPPSSCDEQLASPGIQNNLAYLFRWGCILSFLFSDTDTEEDQDFLRHRPGRRQHALHLRQRKSTTTVPSGLPSSENVTLTSSNRRSSDDADNSSSSADTDASPGSFPSFLPIRCSSAPSTCPTGVTTHALGSPKKSPKASALLTTEPLSNEPATIPFKQTDPVTVPVSVTGLNLLTDSVTENPVSVTGETPQDPPDTVPEDSGSRKPSHDRVVVM